MLTEYLMVGEASTSDPAIHRAARVIREGGLVAFRTETVYGLGANALSESAVRKIFAAKGRPATNPIIVHAAEASKAKALVSEWPPEAQTLANAFWPGALTLVLARAGGVPAVVSAGGPTVAVRVPSDPVARALIEASGVPIAAPSANPSNRVSATTAEHVRRHLDGKIDLVLDAGPSAGGMESTVVRLTGGVPVILRPGLVSAAEIEAALGVSVAGCGISESAARRAGDADESPGMGRLHYAPQARLLVVDESALRTEIARHSLGRVGAILLGPADLPDSDSLRLLRLPADSSGYMSSFYAALHELDEWGASDILVERPPVGREWDAVQDRLRRAMGDGN